MSSCWKLACSACSSSLNLLMKLNRTALSSQFMSCRYLANQFYDRKQPVRRYGYKEKILLRGPLPRLKDANRLPMPRYRPKNSWNEKRALFGQNDYIDILGDGNIRPTRLALHIPYWLRGFAGNEFQMLIRKHGSLVEHMRVMKPKSYDDMRKRIRYLYKFLNRKTYSNR